MDSLLTNKNRLSIKFKASQKTEEDIFRTTGDKCLQLSEYVRLEIRKGKLIPPTCPSEPKAHIPIWTLICRPLGWNIQAVFGIGLFSLKSPCTIS